MKMKFNIIMNWIIKDLNKKFSMRELFIFLKCDIIQNEK